MTSVTGATVRSRSPETINYRTLKPEKDGLFGEQIFGPDPRLGMRLRQVQARAFQGHRLRAMRRGSDPQRVRRERMGHIELAAPVTHIWFFKGVPSRLGYLLEHRPEGSEKVIYFAAYMVTKVTKDSVRTCPACRTEFDNEIANLEQRRNAEIEARAKKVEADWPPPSEPKARPRARTRQAA